MELSEVRVGRSQDYLGPLQRLSDNMNTRKEVAEILKNYRMENINNKFESEEQSALQHFEVNKLLKLKIFLLFTLHWLFCRARNNWHMMV